MTTPSNKAATTGTKGSKLVMQMAIGAIFGAGATYAGLAAVENSGIAMDDPSRLAAFAVGIIFALIGLFIGFGVFAPKSGAHLLSVEDADELRELRTPLWRASMIMILIGAAMLSLALAATGGSSGALSTPAAAIVVAICLIGIAYFSWAGRNDNDEMMKTVSAEASTVALWTIVGVFSVWATLSHLGYAEWVEPLGLLAAMLMLELVAIMWVSTKRGLFRPR